jgi:hypothetical protein
MILIAGEVGYKRNMPQTGEKKSEQFLMNLDPVTYERILSIVRSEDRPKGYVARELMLRGLSLYEQDGKLRGEAPARAKVVATISGGKTKEDVRRDFEREILVPVHDDGTIGKRPAKRKVK